MENKNKIIKNSPLKMQLQYFAEGNPAETGNDPAPSTPNHDDMVAEIARLKAENLTLKNRCDKASSDASDWKKKYRDSQTAEERAADERRIAEEAYQAKVADMEQRLAIIDARDRYARINMDPETASKAALAEISGDKDEVFSIIEKHMKAVEAKAAEDAVQKFLASRPDIASGSGSADPTDLSVEIAKTVRRRQSGGIDLNALNNLMK